MCILRNSLISENVRNFFFLIEFSDFPSGVNERSKGGILEGYVLRKYKNAHSTAQEAKVHFDKAIQTTNRYIS